MLKTPVITLTTDFGLKDPFAGLMKGAILGINPDARIVDITHKIERHNIFEASQVIAMSFRYFPKTTIHVAVVDPGVGSARRPLLVVTEDYFFIGPDNGIFTPIFEQLQSGFFNVYHLNASHYFLPMRGSTFHGRDIFAPCAAWLSKGTESHKLGKPVDDYVTIPVPRPVVEKENSTITGEVVSLDSFGNAITNITRDDLAQLMKDQSNKKFIITFRGESIPLVNYYSENKNRGLAAVINSFGHFELFVYQGSAAELAQVKVGEYLSISLV